MTINNYLTIARRLATVRGERVELCLGIPIVKHPHYFDFYSPPVITDAMKMSEPPTGVDSIGTFLNGSMRELIDFVRRHHLLMMREIDESMNDGAFLALRYAMKIIIIQFKMQTKRDPDFYCWDFIKDDVLVRRGMRDGDIVLRVGTRHIMTSAIPEKEGKQPYRFFSGMDDKVTERMSVDSNGDISLSGDE